MNRKLYGTPIYTKGMELLKPLVDQWYRWHENTIGLHIVSWGCDAPSALYIEKKKVAAYALGIQCYHDNVGSLSEGVASIKKANLNPDVHGILVQLPIEDSTQACELLNIIVSEKDVDGLNPWNQGYDKGIIPCTPWACFVLLRNVFTTLQGLEAVVVGTSRLTGKPLANLLLNHHATVTVAHNYTKNLSHKLCKADIVCTATPVPHLIAGCDIASHAVVIDVGIYRDDRGKIYGNVETSTLKCQAYTPVPKGVGPVTVLGLMFNTIRSAYRSTQKYFPESEILDQLYDTYQGTV